ncbi:hypothetical protein SVIOM74S_01814 [Streptomyces violarus]
MLWWERVAPLGKPVVPDVYWMLIGSSQDRPSSSNRAPGVPRPSSASQLGSPKYTTSRNPAQRPRTCSTIAR